MPGQGRRWGGVVNIVCNSTLKATQSCEPFQGLLETGLVERTGGDGGRPNGGVEQLPLDIMPKKPSQICLLDPTGQRGKWTPLCCQRGHKRLLPCFILNSK